MIRPYDPLDLPEHKRVNATRDTAFLQQQARDHSEAIGRMAQVLLQGALPWTRKRRVYALLPTGEEVRRCPRRGGPRRALDAEMANVERLRRMLEQAAGAAEITTSAAPGGRPCHRAT